MKARGQFLVALLVAAAVVAAALYLDREVGARPLGTEAAPGVPSGAWFCPHGGGSKDWDVWIQLANPGPEPVQIRVRSISSEKPSPPEDHVVEPGSTLVVPVPGRGREASTTVEYFGGFVAAGWIEHAGGDATGVAAEPCLPDTGARWLLPDGTAAVEENDDHVVLMNPHATDAVVSLTLLTDGRTGPVRTEAWTNVTLKPYRSRAFSLNENALGETTVATVVDVSVGRIAAATLGIATGGGIRGSIGLSAGTRTQILPGAGDSGRTALAVMSTGLDRVQLSGTILEAETPQPVAGLADAAPAGETARTVPLTTGTPTTLVVHADGPGVAFARRTFGVGTDQASSAGATAPAGAWIVLPSVIGEPSNPAIVLANPGEDPASVTLTALPAEGGTAPQPVAVEIPPLTTVTAPESFADATGTSSVLATATSGTFVPVSASYALGREGSATYAVAAGVRIPDAWVSASGAVV
ncbi:MAG TPA: DUF5719 family protein [Actinomycetota bacterium]|nr:DUF5719 family protein [Actinomycetota bacterium]